MTPDEFLMKWGQLFLRSAPVIIGMGVGGIVVIVGLLWAWRNHRRRMAMIEERRADRTEPLPHIDAWGSAAARLESEPAEGDDDDLESYDDGYGEDEEDDDGPPPWER